MGNAACTVTRVATMRTRTSSSARRPSFRTASPGDRPADSTCGSSCPPIAGGRPTSATRCRRSSRRGRSPAGCSSTTTPSTSLRASGSSPTTISATWCRGRHLSQPGPRRVGVACRPPWKRHAAGGRGRWSCRPVGAPRYGPRRLRRRPRAAADGLRRDGHPAPASWTAGGPVGSNRGPQFHQWRVGLELRKPVQRHVPSGPENSLRSSSCPLCRDV